MSNEREIETELICQQKKTVFHVNWFVNSAQKVQNGQIQSSHRSFEMLNAIIEFITTSSYRQYFHCTSKFFLKRYCIYGHKHMHLM